MKYYIDTEFIESVRKPFFGKPYHFMQLISIGIVAEDGREYYAISSEFDYKKANDWVKENVIRQLPLKLRKLEALSEFSQRCGLGDDYEGPWYNGKDLATIGREIINFVNPRCIQELRAGLWPDMSEVELHNPNSHGWAQPEFYAYYANYDWVIFCSIFGDMSRLPKGFPMYCKDLKHIMDDNDLTDDWKRKNHPDPVGEHSAIIDARWNKQLHEKILKLYTT